MNRINFNEQDRQRYVFSGKSARQCVPSRIVLLTNDSSVSQFKL